MYLRSDTGGNAEVEAAQARGTHAEHGSCGYQPSRVPNPESRVPIFRENEKGIGLIEILLMVVVLVFIVMVVMMVLYTGSKKVVSTGNSTIAVKLCQETIEIIRKMETKGIPEGTFPPDTSLLFPQGTYGPVTVGKENGTRTISVRKIIDPESTGTNTGYLEIITSVTWQEDERIRSRLLATYKK
ncbi:MAG: hypothetical protein AB1422_13035 [bacterium]